MKTYFQTILLAFACSTCVVLAQDEYNTNNTFATTNSIVAWDHWFGAAGFTIGWDAAKDASNNVSSGALKLQVLFDSVAHAGDNQAAFRGPFSGIAGDAFSTYIDGTLYSHLDMDIMFDPGSPAPGGNFGTWQLGFYTGGQGPVGAQYTQVVTTNYVPTVAGGTSWVHLHVPINPTLNGIGFITGIYIKADQGTFTGTTTFWVDNIKLVPSATPPAAPTVSIEKPVPGLNLFTSSTDIYQFQSLATFNNSGYTWVNAPAYPVTYSLTLADYPDPVAHTLFQAHMIWVAGNPGANYAAHYVEPNALYIQIQSYADGKVGGQLMWKTNSPNSTGQYYGVGNLGQAISATRVGTWTVTFINNTDGTITGPDGTSQVFSIPASVAALFDNPLTVYLGTSANGQVANIGQQANITKFQITGVASPILDTFSGPSLDTGTWVVRAADPAGVVQVPSATAYWLGWTLPATGYGVQASTLLGTGASWADPGLTPMQIAGKGGAILVPQGVPGANAGYFRLIKP